MDISKHLYRINNLPGVIQTFLEMTIEGVIILRYSLNELGISQIEYYFINDRAGEIVSKKAENYIGKSPGIHLHPEDDPKAVEAVVKTINGEDQEIELRILPEGTEMKVVQVKLRLLHETESEKFIICLVNDITQTKQTNAELTKQTEMRRKYFEASGHMFVVLDSQGLVVDVNSKACEVLGWESQEIIGQDWFEKFVPEEVNQDVSAIFHRLMKGEILNTEFFQNEIKTREGLKIISWRNSILRDESEMPIGTISSGEDITEAKFHEDLLIFEHELITQLAAMESFEDTLSFALSSLLKVSKMSGGGIYLYDKSGNLKLVCHHGLPESFVAKVKSYQANAPNSLLVKKGQAYYSTHKVLLDNMGATDRGEKMLMALAIIPIIVSGQVMGCFNLGSFTEQVFPERLRTPVETIIKHASVIIARKLLRDQLEKSEETMRLILNTIPDMVYMADKDGLVLFANKLASDTLGIPLNNVGNIKIWEVLDDSAQELAKKNIEEIIATGIPSRDVRYILKSRNGEPIPVEAHLAVWRSKDDMLLIGLARDLRDKIQSEAEINKLQEGLIQSQKFEVLGTLAAGIAHDLNNVLMGVFGYFELIKMKAVDSSVKELADSGFKTAESAADLIQRILPFARASKPVKKLTDLKSLLKSAMHICTHTYPQKIALNYKTELKSAMFQGDQNLILHSVIMNILNNARDAVLEIDHPKINISLEQIRLRKKDIPQSEAIASGNYLLLTVEDNGSGMDIETQRHMFDLLFTTKEIGKGTGIGLTSAKEVIKSHGGMILCESTQGIGTKFSIYFPQVNEHQDEQPQFEQIFPSSHGTILLVDDRKENLLLLANQAEVCGYKTLLASNGEEAFHLWLEKRSEIDLVIMDFDMPKMDGLQTLEKMHQIDNEVCCFIVSGTPFKKDEITTATQVFLKPWLSDLWVEAAKVMETKKK